LLCVPTARHAGACGSGAGLTALPGCPPPPPPRPPPPLHARPVPVARAATCASCARDPTPPPQAHVPPQIKLTDITCTWRTRRGRGVRHGRGDPVRPRVCVLRAQAPSTADRAGAHAQHTHSSFFCDCTASTAAAMQATLSPRSGHRAANTEGASSAGCESQAATSNPLVRMMAPAGNRGVGTCATPKTQRKTSVAPHAAHWGAGDEARQTRAARGPGWW
jgi:hypothetical protein